MLSPIQIISCHNKNEEITIELKKVITTNDDLSLPFEALNIFFVSLQDNFNVKLVNNIQNTTNKGDLDYHINNPVTNNNNRFPINKINNEKVKNYSEFKSSNIFQIL